MGFDIQKLDREKFQVRALTELRGSQKFAAWSIVCYAFVASACCRRELPSRFVKFRL